MDTLVSLDHLLEITGYKTAGDLDRSLTSQGIRLFRGKGGIRWTTMELINAAGGLRPDNQQQDPPKYGANTFSV